jgi:hypothetical protein
MTSSNAVIFTSVPASRLNLSSSVFKQYHNAGDVPCPVSQANIVGAELSFHVNYCLFRQSLPEVVHSNLNNTETPLGSYNNILPDLTAKKSRLSLPEPQITVSFEGAELRKAVEPAMLQHGFKKETQSRNVHYTGTGSLAAVQAAVNHGADINCWTPTGYTNISGYLAFVAIRSLYRRCNP